MSDTKCFTFFLAKDGYWLCPLRCRIFLMLPLLQYPIAKVTFKELQHCQNHKQRPQRGTEKMYKFSDAPLARPNLHIPRLSRGSCRQGAADRGIFSFPKIREQRLWRLILSVLCLFVPFWAPKRKDRNDWLSDCNKWLRVKTTAEYKSKHHIMVMDSSINRIVEETYIELTLI